MQRTSTWARSILPALLVWVYACQPINEKHPPNILWIYLEDTSPLLGCYGTSLISTPNIDKLASQGILYRQVVMPAPVCSACRSSIITGVMATTLGLQNHHSSRTPESAIYLPDSIKTLPELFKENGFFTFNNGKDDYNFQYDRQNLYSQDYSSHPLYGKKGDPINFSDLRHKTPFFGQIQLSGGKEIFSSTFDKRKINPVDRSKISLPPYLPDHPVIIEEYANHLDAIQITDEKVGKILEELKVHELLDNTIVFFFSDHGMRMTRHKQFLYDGGLMVPLIVADFTQSTNLDNPGSISEDLVAGIDLGPSSLALAGIQVPEFMVGKNIFSKKDSPREYVISTRDRCDFTIDRIRSVRSKDFKYIRNFMTDRPYTQPTYMDVDGVPFVKTMKALHESNKLDSVQARFFLSQRPSEELYDLKKDPHEINNLATNHKYAEVLNKYAVILDDWIKETDDQGQYPEKNGGLKLMLGIWGKHAVNPEYESLRKAYPNLASSQFGLKSAKWEKFKYQ